MFLRYELKAQAGWVGSGEVPHHCGAAKGQLLLLGLGGSREACDRQGCDYWNGPGLCPGFLRLLKKDTAVLT